ncbi:PHP domain-containing protein [Acetobacterium wieringae]|uniref:PHP domain-containing protein n=1 Tax=Acetobacterium wieringae TaxID=52694 RepID=UPI0026F36986|nr:PHP domain-containing protein [Acetobacterium wieringae]
MGKIDLHVHTRASVDGELSGEELIRLAIKENVSTLAITDHDSIEEVDNAMAWGEKLGVEVIPGTEVFCQNRSQLVHLLAYYIDLDESPVSQIIETVNADRKRWLQAQIKLLKENGLYLDEANVYEFSKDTSPAPSSLSYGVFKDERNTNHPLIIEYNKKYSNPVLEFALQFLVFGKPFYAPNYIPETKVFIEAVHRSGGVAVLAHPGYTQMKVDFIDTTFVDELLEQGLSGVEAYYTTHSEEETQRYLAYCKKHQLLFTSGSDFHGKFKPTITLGQLGTTDYSIIERLNQEKNRIRKKERMRNKL